MYNNELVMGAHVYAVMNYVYIEACAWASRNKRAGAAISGRRRAAKALVNRIRSICIVLGCRLVGRR